jgi:hypothetical protein
MDPAMTYGGIVTILCGAISTLFWLYTAELRRQIAKQEEDRKTEADQLRKEKDELAAELKATALKAEESIRTEQVATRQELAELRKTNAALVAALSGKEVTP